MVGEESYGFSDSITFGPVAEFGVVEPIADVTVFNDTFDLNFEDRTFDFSA